MPQLRLFLLVRSMSRLGCTRFGSSGIFGVPPPYRSCLAAYFQLASISLRQVVGRVFARLRPWSWHRFGPCDMPFEAKRFRHVAVAIPQVHVGRAIAVSARQQSPQPQQPDVAYHQTLIGWRGR